MKKLLIIILCFISTSLFSLTQEEIKKTNTELLKKSGLPILDSEIEIVSFNDFFNNQYISSKDRVFINELKKKYQEMNKEQNEKGYVEEDNLRAQELISIKLNPKKNLNQNFNEIKMGYIFLSIPDSKDIKTIGYSPMGSYKELKNGDDSDGWDGIVQFFNYKQIGFCAYTEHNIKLAHSGAQLIREFITYDVSNKPCIIIIKGNEITGYTYKISWYDDTFIRDLECANKKYDSELTNKLIELANFIDKL